jgi:hypothetical protein
VRGIGLGYLVQCKDAGAHGEGLSVPLSQRRGLLLVLAWLRSSLLVGRIDGQLLRGQRQDLPTRLTFGRILFLQN